MLLQVLALEKEVGDMGSALDGGREWEIEHGKTESFFFMRENWGWSIRKEQGGGSAVKVLEERNALIPC